MLIVYKIKHIESDNCYIGSTKNLNLRIQRHRANLKAKDKKHFKLYTFINENGGFENFDISILASIDNVDIDDICKKEQLEQKYIDKIQPTLNNRNAYLTKERKTELVKEYNKNYGNQIITCVCGSLFKHKNKSKHIKTIRHKDFICNKPIILTFE